ncbi:MAG: NAD(P)H-dependent oxidoreductase [Bacteroidales bacterium]|nr:NAD(P)H-dependent oxidoreductase [Bacteroidales bacterium]
MNIIDSLKWRYATKDFDTTKKLSEQQVETLLKAGNLTATSFGLQPGKIVLVETTEIREKLVGYSWGQKQVSEASHLLVITSNINNGDEQVDKYVKDIVEQRGVTEDSLTGMSKMVKGFLAGMDDDKAKVWADYQAHIVLGNLLTVCAVEGIDACPIAGFQPEKYDEVLNLKEIGQTSVLVLPIGFRLDTDKYATLSKVRMPDSEFVIRK